MNARKTVHPTSPLTSINNAAARWVALPFLKGYHVVLSPIFTALGSQCRFYPTCSHYAEEAFRLHGFARGLALTTVRVAKCNPFHPGGIDPVPGSELEKELSQESDSLDKIDTSSGDIAR